MIKIIRFYFLISIVFVSYIAESQVIIKGKAPGAEGKFFSVSIFADLLTFEEQRLGACFIDDSANFYLKIPDLKSTKLAFMQIDYSQAAIFLEPQSTYTIDFMPYNYDTLYNEANPFVEPLPLDYRWVDEPYTSFNNLYYLMDSVYTDFLLKNQRRLISGKARGLSDSLHKEFRKGLPTNRSDYLDGVIKYRVAKIKLLGIHRFDSVLTDRYWLNAPILYDNIEYMQLFNSYFSDFVLKDAFPNDFENREIKAAINDSADFNLLDTILSKSKLLKKKQFRELVILANINRFFKEKEFKDRQLLEILEQIIANSKFEEHRLIAKNMLLGKVCLAEGFKAPEFYMLNQTDSAFLLSDFEGKYVYLSFWTTKCINCISEFYVMDRLHQEFGDSVEFISICIDKTSDNMRLFAEQNQFPIKYLHSSGIDLLKAYQVSKFPFNVFIDKESYIISNPAPLPSRELPDLILEKLGVIDETLPNKGNH